MRGIADWSARAHFCHRLAFQYPHPAVRWSLAFQCPHPAVRWSSRAPALLPTRQGEPGLTSRHGRHSFLLDSLEAPGNLQDNRSLQDNSHQGFLLGSLEPPGNLQGHSLRRCCFHFRMAAFLEILLRLKLRSREAQREAQICCSRPGRQQCMRRMASMSCWELEVLLHIALRLRNRRAARS